MYYQPILLIVFLCLPVFIIILTERNRLASRIGSILIAYGVGLLIGNIGLFPVMGKYLADFLKANPTTSIVDVERLLYLGLIGESNMYAYRIHELQNLLLMISVPIAIPLLLFSLNIRVWFRMAGKTFTAMLLALFSVLLVISTLVLIFREKIPEMNHIAGMLVGLYTGGTPNLAALKMMLNIDAETYIMVHTYDMIPSLAYLLFLVSFGKGLFRKFLRPYPLPKDSKVYDQLVFDKNPYRGFFKRKIILPLLTALGIAVLIFGIGGLFTLFLPESIQMLVVILAITTLGIAASLIPKINGIEKTFELGMYFILLFSVVVASMANVKSLMNISGDLLLIISLAIFGTLLLHTLLARIFKVDADTLMVTSTALICSPPFVPMISGALNNKEVLVSGLTVGIMGYAIGNYLGVLVSYFFRFVA